jgi:hypothetical protein
VVAVLFAVVCCVCLCVYECVIAGLLVCMYVCVCVCVSHLLTSGWVSTAVCCQQLVCTGLKHCEGY